MPPECIRSAFNISLLADSKRDSAALFYDIADEYVMYGKVLRQARAEFWPFRPTDAPLVNGKKPTAAVDFDFTFVRSSSQNAKWWEGNSRFL